MLQLWKRYMYSDQDKNVINIRDICSLSKGSDMDNILVLFIIERKELREEER